MTSPQNDPRYNDSDPVLLTRGSVNRTRDAVKYVETMIRGGPGVRRPGQGGQVIGRKVKTGAGGIPAATANDTPGQAACTFCDWNGTKWVPGTDSDTVMNPSASAIGANRIVSAMWMWGGYWEVIVDPCGF